VQASDVTTPDPGRDRLYRPLTLFSFALNYAADGLNPRGYHAVNIVLHALCCVLMWHFGAALLGRTDAATVAALLFAVHPVHCEAVANIVGRAEVLAALLLLAGMSVLIRPGRPPGAGRTLLAALAFFAALLAKETAVCYLLVALIGLHHLHGAGRLGRGWWLARLALLALPLAAYFPLRITALEGQLLRSADPAAIFNPLFVADLGGRLLGPLTILGHYARLMLIPSKLSADYGLGIIQPVAALDAWSVGMTLSGAATLILLAVCLGGYRHPRHSQWRAFAVLCAMLAASYALISNTVILIGVSLAERLMYWPSAPALLLVSLAVCEGWRRWVAGAGPLAHRAALLRAAGLMLLAALCLRTVTRNAAWADDRTLFGTDFRAWPDNIHLAIVYARNLVYAANDETDPRRRAALLDEAQPIVEQALARHQYSEALRTMGELLALRGDAPRAMQFLQLARRLNPRDAATQDLIAQLEGRDFERAAAALRERIARAPQDVSLRLELATLLLGHGRQRPAREHLEHAFTREPQNVAVLRLLAQVEMLDHADERAITLFREVVAREPDDWATHVNLSYLLQARDAAACLQHAERAFALRPDAFEVQTGLAEALVVNGQAEAGAARLEGLLSRLPTDDPRRLAVRERIEHIRRLGR